jgi:hypothetical protein
MEKTTCNLLVKCMRVAGLFTGKKKVVAVCAFIATALSMTSLTANGQITNYNGTISLSTLGGSLTTDLPMFNGALGTLTGVQVTLDITATPFAQVLNTTFSPNTFTSSDWASAGFNPATNTWTVSLGSDSWNVTPPTVTTGPIYGTGQSVASFTILKLIGSTSAPADLTAASGLDFAAYTGAGDLVFGSNGTGNWAGSGTGFGFGGGANLTGTASVTYDFVPAPEPPTAGCFLIGLGVLAVTRRFKQNGRVRFLPIQHY